MIALAYLAAGAIYFSIMFYAVAIAWRWGRRNARTSTRAFICATLAFLAVYLPVFWDHIPTLVAHRYYCGKDGGAVVYRDPNEWMKLHQSEAESLRVAEGGERVRKEAPDGWTREYLVNRIVAHDRQHSEIQVMPGLYLWREARRLFDIRANETIAVQVSYGRVYPAFQSGGMRFWVGVSGCNNEINAPVFGSAERALAIERRFK